MSKCSISFTNLFSSIGRSVLLIFVLPVKTWLILFSDRPITEKTLRISEKRVRRWYHVAEILASNTVSLQPRNHNNFFKVRNTFLYKVFRIIRSCLICRDGSSTFLRSDSVCKIVLLSWKVLQMHPHLFNILYERFLQINLLWILLVFCMMFKRS